MKKNFKIVINPFTNQYQITLDEETQEGFYNSTDEWIGLWFGGRPYDFHFHYDEEFTVSAYDVLQAESSDETVTSFYHNVELTIKLNEK